VAIAKELPAF